VIVPEVRPTVAVSKTVRANCFSTNRRRKTQSCGGNSLAAVAVVAAAVVAAVAAVAAAVVAAAFDHDSSVFLRSVDLIE